MEQVSGPGTSAIKTLVIRFVSDFAKASRDIDHFIMKVTRLQQTLKNFQSIKTTVPNPSFGGWYGHPSAMSTMAPMGGGRAGGSMSPYSPYYGMAGMASMTTPVESTKKVKESVEAVKKANGLFHRMGEMFQNKLTPGLSMSILGFEAIIRGISRVTRMLKKMLEPFIRMGNLMEGSIAQLEVITGSTKRAHTLGKGFVEYSRKTPFLPKEILSSGTAAVQYGFKEPLEKGAYNLPQGKNLMDVIAGLGSFRTLGGDVIGVGRAVYAMMRGERRMLRHYPQEVQTAHEIALQSGRRASTAYREKFVEELGKIPAIMNMAERHSRTVAGLWSTIAGFANEFFISMSGAAEEKGVPTLWSKVRDILLDIRDWGLSIIEDLKPGWIEFGSLIGSVFKFIAQLIKSLSTLLGPHLAILIGSVRVLGQIFMFILDTGAKFAKVIIGAVTSVDKLVSAVLGIKSAFKGITDAFSEFVTGLQITFQFMSIFIDYLFKDLGASIQRIFSGPAFDALRVIGKLVGKERTTGKPSGTTGGFDFGIPGLKGMQGIMKLLQEKGLDKILQEQNLPEKKKAGTSNLHGYNIPGGGMGQINNYYNLNPASGTDVSNNINFSGRIQRADDLNVFHRPGAWG